MFNFSNYSEVLLLLKNQQLWMHLNYFQSASTVQSLLKKYYDEQNFPKSERKSYDNCYPFMYYLEQGEAYYTQASQSPLPIKPVLLFYGLSQLLKACLLIVDPEYPSVTSVLAHGVSTRKRKKRDYEFLHDEVKIQKNGLCTHFVEKMFRIHHLEGEKFKMGDLLALVPELDELYFLIKGKSNIILLKKQDHHIWHIPSDVAYLYYMNEQRLKTFLESKHKGTIYWYKEKEDRLLIDGSQTKLKPPFRYHLYKEAYCLPSSIEANKTIPDLLVHYLLLYNLSMIGRYETEWWLDLIKATAQPSFPLIKSFLTITAEKGLDLILHFLNSNLIKKRSQ